MNLLDGFKKYGLEIVSWILIFLSPIKSALVALLALIAVDFVTGIWAARKRGEAITSRGMRQTVSKITAYLLGVILAFIVEKYLMDGAIPLVHLVSGFAGMGELKSIFENLNAITGINLVASLITQFSGVKPNVPPSNDPK
jgi:phage-related holin